jgi:hypothetical protein
MFCVKGFAAGSSAGRYFGFAAIAIGGIAIAARIAVAKHAGSSVGPQTFATEKLQKECLIKGIDREPIENG